MFSPRNIARLLARLAVGLMLCGVFGMTLPDPQQARADSAEVTKKKPRRGLRARGKQRRPNAKRLVDQEAKADATAVRPRYVLMVVVGLFLLILHVRQRRRDREEAAPERDVSQEQDDDGGNVHQPRAVVLDPKAGIDPLVAEASRAGPINDGNAAAAREIERLTTADIKLRMSQHDAKFDARRGALRLPGAFEPHFEALPNETMQWTAQFNVFGISKGTLGITNFRCVAVHEQRKLSFLPPAYRRELRRHQMALPTIAKAEQTAVPRPLFLALGALTFLVFPIGTAIACVAMGCYFAVLRPVLCVTIGSVGHMQRRYYPLHRADIVEAQRVLSQLTGRGNATPASPETKQKAG